MLLTKPQLKQTKMPKDTDVLVLILLYKNPDFKGTSRPYDLELFGKKMWKYVESACKNYSVKTTFITSESDILSTIKPMLTPAKTTLVFYSDTPLLQSKTVEEILAVFEIKNFSFMKLSRGFVFKTEYLKSLKDLPSLPPEHFNEEDFITIFDSKQYEFASQILKLRILDKLQQSGIIFPDLNTVFVDCDVEIASGVVVEPNNIIKGNTKIEKGVILHSGNIIINSHIGENSQITSAYIENSNIESGRKILPFEKIIG